MTVVNYDEKINTNSQVFDSTFVEERDLLTYMTMNTQVNSEFIVWFFDQLRGVDSFLNKGEVFRLLLESVVPFAGSENRFTTPRFIRMLSELPIFEYRISGKLSGEVYLWRPYKESFRVFACKIEADNMRAWFDPDKGFNSDDIYNWLKLKHDDFISKK